MSNINIPKPTIMPKDALIRENKLSLVNFINSYYIYRDIKKVCRR